MIADATDPELWARAISGDSRAFASIFDRHRDRVFWHLRRAIDDPTHAEDLTATVFLELWRRRTSARIVDESLLPWLLVTASNTARNANRSTRRYRRFLARLPPPDITPDFQGDIDRSIDATAEIARLRASLTALSALDRQLIELTALDGLTLSEASGALGISYGAAKTRLSRARSRLNALRLDEPGVSP